MASLNATSLRHLPSHVKIPTYDRKSAKHGIVHFGVGNFHRAHQAVLFDRFLNEFDSSDWGIIGIGMTASEHSRHKAEALRAQDCLYTCTEFGTYGDPVVRVVGSILDYIYAPDDRQRALDTLVHPNTRIVTLTVTAPTYAAAQHATGPTDKDVESPFGLIGEALQIRRDTNAGPFTIVSCDNLRHNGDVARDALLKFWQLRDKELAEWIDQNVTFPNCVVDRITPSVREDHHLDQVLGFKDTEAVVCEDWIQWVIEDKFCAGRPQLEKVGVLFTDAIAPFEQLKYRVLNACHTMLAFPSVLAGYKTVHEAMEDPTLNKLLDMFLDEYVLPTIEAPKDIDAAHYKEIVLRRLRNTSVGDQISRLASNGLSKINRFLKETLDLVLPSPLNVDKITFLFACYARYLGGLDDAGNHITVNEPELHESDFVLAKDADLGKACEMPLFQPWADSAKFRESFVRSRQLVATQGALATLRSITGPVSSLPARIGTLTGSLVALPCSVEAEHSEVIELQETSAKQLVPPVQAMSGGFGQAQ